MARTESPTSLIQAPIAIVLAWLIPGLGHVYLGHKARGLIFLVAITLTFWTGVAIGGVKSVHPLKPAENLAGSEEPRMSKSWWFFAQVLNGGFAITSYTIGKAVPDVGPSGEPRYVSWPSGEIASVYTGVAGLLNLLIILDALAGAEGITRRGPDPRIKAGTPQRGPRHG